MIRRQIQQQLLLLFFKKKIKKGKKIEAFLFCCCVVVALKFPVVVSIYSTTIQTLPQHQRTITQQSSQLFLNCPITPIYTSDI